MADQALDHPSARLRRPASPASSWLKRYYFTRFAFSAAWVAAALSVAENVPPLAAVMLVGYPAWDAVANLVDAQRSGGLTRNKAQFLNVVVSIVTALAVAVALAESMNSVLVVFGIWAGFSGIPQLAAAPRAEPCGRGTVRFGACSPSLLHESGQNLPNHLA